MSWVAVAIGGAALVSGVASGVASSEAADSARDAQDANTANARAQRELEYKMFQEGRGSTGSAFLPLYFQGYEQELARDARRIYEAERAAAGTPEQELAAYNRLLARMRPAIDASTGAIEDIYSGELTDRRLSAARPVAAARTALAGTRAASIEQSLAERLNALKADRMRSGFVGDSSFDRNRLFQATLGARAGAAEARAGADYENALADLGIRESGEQARLQYVNAPIQRAQQELALMQLPSEMATQGYQRRLQTFEPFRIGTQTFRPTPLPLEQPIPGAGQIAATGIGQAANSAADLGVSFYLANQLNQQRTAAQQQARMRAEAGYYP